MRISKKRFEDKFVKEPSGCWRWTACFQGTGYGYFYLNGRLTTAPRASLLLYKNIDAGNQFVCHTCDNRWCVNPDHLFLGDAKANLHDCITKGRFIAGNHSGQHNGRAVLSPDEVAEIRRLAQSGLKRAAILAKFPISTSQYHRIVNKTHWPVEGIIKSSEAYEDIEENA